jgi:hypothetical protein
MLEFCDNPARASNAEDNESDGEDPPQNLPLNLEHMGAAEISERNALTRVRQPTEMHSPANMLARNREACSSRCK